MADFDLENVATDPESLAKAFEALQSGESPTEKTAEPAPKDPETPAPEEPAKVEPEGKTQQQDGLENAKPDGVATKDGKHVIPYSVLESERKRASRAEEMAQEMKARVAELEAIVKSASEGAKIGESARTEPQQQTAASDLSPEDLEALKEDFPTVYKSLMASMAAVKALEAKLAPVENTVREAQADQQRSAAETVQDAIDSIPKLAHIQATNQDAFELAKQFDATLRNNPAWADKPLAERFEKVTQMVEAALGEIEVPGQAKTTLSAEDLKKAAAAKAAAATKANKSAVPTSLSEFPAGNPAAQDEREAAETMTTLQLAEHMSKMTPDQMDAYFQSL